MMMKKYIKPQVELNEFEVEDIIAVSSVGGGLFGGLADLDNSESTTFDDSILDPKDIF